MTEYNKDKANLKMEYHFPIPVMDGHFPGTEQLNLDLLDYVLEAEKAGLRNYTKDKKLGTIGGYQPKWQEGFLEEPVDCVKFLKNEIILPSINQYVNHYLDIVNGPTTGNHREGLKVPNEIDMIVNSWTVLYREGNFQAPHIHHKPQVSGVYFASVPENLEPPYGALVFSNPYLVNTFNGYDTNKIFMPKPGDIILFPSWYMHQAYPFYGEGHRLSIVFDCYFNLTAEMAKQEKKLWQEKD